MKTVRELMTKNPACCGQDANLQECARIMCENDCGEIPVVSGDRKLLGVITDRDICCRAVAKGENPQNARVESFMTRDCVTVMENASLDDCLEILRQHQIRRIPVVDGQGCCVGIVSQADIARATHPMKTGELVKDVSQPMHAHA